MTEQKWIDPFSLPELEPGGKLTHKVGEIPAAEIDFRQLVQLAQSAPTYSDFLVLVRQTSERFARENECCLLVFYHENRL
jgi:hypothetical protein